MPMRHTTTITTLLILPAVWLGNVPADDKQPDRPWRALPLITGGKVDPNWVQVGWGGFAVDGDALRTDCDERGMGLLLYKKETFGDCQLRVVYRPRDPKSNSGLFVRIDDGILDRLAEKAPAVRRGEDGKLSGEMLDRLKGASEKGLGPWYAVHHGYEVQVCDDADPSHRTGAIYSLARAAPLPKAGADGWRTMVVTLRGDRVLVDVDGTRVCAFGPGDKGVPAAREWYEPKREPRRPRAGYVGLQNHDPGDVVHFKEVGVRPLDAAP